MDALRRPEVLEALKAVTALIDDLIVVIQPVEHQAKGLAEELSLLQQQREYASKRIAPIHLIPDDVLEALAKAAEGLDICIRQTAEVSRSAELRLASLRAEHQVLEELQRKLASQISPAEILPEELLVEIWMWVRLDDSEWEWAEYSGIPFPYVISWVSSRWRKVAIGSPILWREVHVSNNRSVALVQTQIQRSKTCTLAVIMPFVSPYNREDDDKWQERMQDVVNVLLGCSHRWYSLQLGSSIPYTSSWSSLQSLYQGNIVGLLGTTATRLRHLRIGWPGPICGEPLIIRETPMLSHIELRSVNIHSNLPLLRGITHLTLADIPILGLLTELEFLNMLEACPLLTYLSLEEECFILDSNTGHPSVINIPSLRSLTVSFDGDDSDDGWIPGLFKRLSMAGLQSLRVAFLRDSYKSFISVMRLISPSSRYPALSKLSLCTDKDYSSRVETTRSTRELLLLFPQIEHLELDLKDKDILDILAVLAHGAEASGQPPCPRLRTLDCSINLSTGQERALRSHIAKRTSIGSPITKLRLDTRYMEYTNIYSLRERLQGCVYVEDFNGWTERAFCDCFIFHSGQNF